MSNIKNEIIKRNNAIVLKVQFNIEQKGFGNYFAQKNRGRDYRKTFGSNILQNGFIPISCFLK